jgi:eukaryotic-like serine/threonine-protein kinase
LTPEDWAQAWAALQSASELPPEGRLAFVQNAKIAEHVREQVLAMLEGEEPETGKPKPGNRYGRYELIAPLGSGGSGDVYSARDEQLGRMAAIKFLKPAGNLLPAARERLIREAQAASALNHPNLVTVYEVLETESGMALVTELIDGQTLRTMCGRPRPWERVAEWGQQIARGLAAAHEQGIVHGDVKPENAMVRKDGYLKVVDFGLAQADLDGHRANNDIDSIPLGTLGYMSPEQLEGRASTPASDIFALGVVLYELTAGKHPFLENTARATTSAILERELELPQVPRLRTGAPELQSLIRDPARRPSAADVARRLDRLVHARPPLRPVAWFALAGVAAALGAAGWWWRSPKGLRVGPPAVLAELEGSVGGAGFSPDGRSVVFVWSGRQGDNFDIYTRGVGDGTIRRVTEDPREDYSPAWSPDGKRIAFLRRASEGADSHLLVVDAAGGAPQSVARVADAEGYRGMAWWPDSQSLVVRDGSARGRALTRIQLADGRKETVTNSVETQDFSPKFSPDGQRLAYLRHSLQTRYLCLKELRSGADSCVALRPGGSASIAWLGDSATLLYADGRTISSIAIGGDGEIGRPIALGQSPFRDLATDRAGSRVLFSRVQIDQNLWRLHTQTGAFSLFDATPAEESEPDYSGDGQQIVYRSNRSGTYQLYVAGQAGGAPRQLTFLSGHVGSPRFSPDGKWIVFDGGSMPLAGGKTTSFNNIFAIAANGGAVRQLTDDTAERIVPAWSSDGKWVYYLEERGSARETWKLPFEGGDPVRVHETEMFDLREDAEGQWIYYTRPRVAKGIWRRRVSGGAASLVEGTADHRYRCWDMRHGKLYFLNGVADFGFLELEVGSGRSRKIGGAPRGVTHGGRIISAAPGGGSVVFTQLDKSEGGLFLAEVSGRALTSNQP